MELEKQYDSLVNDVRSFEGNLADYNLAQDKFRAGTKTEDITALYHHIRQQNEKKKAQLDELFIERKEMDNDVSDIERQIQEINIANEERLNELDPDQRTQYDNLKKENSHYINEINTMKSELDKVNSNLANAEQQLRQDNLRQRAHHLKKERLNLIRKKEELEIINNESNLPFPEAREKLIRRIK